MLDNGRENQKAIYTGDARYGKSLYAKKDFQKDDLIFVAFGPIVTKATKHTIPISPTLKIDPTIPEENLSQFICHSCDPNMGIKSRTLFVAMRDIKMDEEVTIDYAMIGYEYGDEMTEEERLCKCGSEQCRGKLGCYKELPDDIKKKYEGYVSDWLLQEL
jgi:uncharacterized protein